MKNFLSRIKNGEILIGHGAMGTILMEKGLKAGECPENLNVNNPSLLEEVAQLYIQAGSDIIDTNTFGASPLKLSAYGLEKETDLINKNAVLAVKKSIGEKENIYVSSSCGPSGKMLKPYGDIGAQKMYDNFYTQLESLIKAGTDIICIETMIDIEEAKLAIKAAKDICTNIPVIATMTFDDIKRGFYTPMGINIENAAKKLEQAGADIIGSNCGNGIDNMVKIAQEFKQYSNLPIIIQSNAGLPKIDKDKVYYSETPEYMAEKAKKLVKMGVSIIGGCCGTTPDHIKAFKEMVRAAK